MAWVADYRLRPVVDIVWLEEPMHLDPILLEPRIRAIGEDLARRSEDQGPGQRFTVAFPG